MQGLDCYANPEPTGLSFGTGHRQIAAQAWGPEDGEPVLALHGWLDNSNSFAPLAAYLPGVRLVAIDLPGHGESAHRPAGCSYQLADYLDDVLDVIDELRWARCRLLGHSMGGAIACLLAAAMPQRISHLACIEALGPLSGSADDAAAQLRKAVAARRQRGQRPARLHHTLDSAIAARRAAAEIGEPAARLLVARSLQRVDDGWIWRSDARLRLPTALRIGEQRVQVLLREIQCPFWLLSAEPPMPYIDQQQYQLRLQCPPQLTHLTLAGSHHLHMERAQDVADRLLPFLIA